MLEELQTVISYLLYFLNLLSTRDKISIVLFIIAGIMIAKIIVDYWRWDDEDF